MVSVDAVASHRTIYIAPDLVYTTYRLNKYGAEKYRGILDEVARFRCESGLTKVNGVYWLYAKFLNGHIELLFPCPNAKWEAGDVIF